jgi:ferrous iron transport protein A
VQTSIAELKIGQKGIISDFNIEEIPLKLLEMGCLPGNSIELIQIAPFGCPLYFNVNDSHVAIRLETAKEIIVVIENQN